MLANHLLGKTLQPVAIAVILTLLAACGGGSSTPAPSPTPSPQPITDTTDPVITLIGDAEVIHPQGEAYIDAGASATDDVDGALNVSPSGTVNEDEPGQYTITYTATDSAGNSTTATRTVTVSADLIVFKAGVVDPLWD